MVLDDTATMKKSTLFEQLYPGLKIVQIHDEQSSPYPFPPRVKSGSFVMFRFKKTYPRATCWASFNALMRSLTGPDAIGLNDPENPWVNVEITKSVFSDLVFRIRGRIVLPVNLCESYSTPKSRVPAAT